ncbi:hypothetical protein GCM10027085_50900 [Spirosoma aerophilum]
MAHQETESDQYKELIRHLAFEWIQIERPGVHFTYADYVRVIGRLLTATQSADRTTYIFMAVLNQAIQLGKTSAWIEQEIRFEILAEGIERSDLVRIFLYRTDPVDDDTLDTYNERRTRFPSSSKANQSA